MGKRGKGRVIRRPEQGRSLFGPHQWVGDEGGVVLVASALEATVDNGPTRGVEIRVKESPEFMTEEGRKNFGTLIVGLFADLGLFVHVEEPVSNDAAFHEDGGGQITEKGAAGWMEILGSEFSPPAPSDIFAGDPLRHEADLPSPDVLVGHEKVFHLGGIDDLLQQKVGLIDLATGGEGPVGTDSLGAHAPSVNDTGVGVAAGRDESPEPGQGGWQEVKKTKDAVGGFFAGAGRTAHPEAADINLDGLVEDAGNYAPWNDDAGVGARLTGGILNMFPDEGGGAGLGLDIQKEDFFGRIDGQLFQMGIGTVFPDVVDADKPGILGIDDAEFAGPTVEGGMTERHIVGHGP